MASVMSSRFGKEFLSFLVLMVYAVFFQGCTAYDYPIYDVGALCSPTPTVIRLSPFVPALVIRKNTKKDGILPPRNCSFVFQPLPGHGVLVSPRSIRLQKDSLGLCLEYLEFNFMSAQDSSASSIKVCQKRLKDQNLLTSFSGEPGADFGNMAIHFVTLNPSQEPRTPSYFELVISQYHDTPCDGDFKCRHGLCLTPELVCDKLDNCGDSSDESSCPETFSRLSLLGYSLGGGLLLVGCIMAVACFVRSKRKPPKTAYDKMREELFIF